MTRSLPNLAAASALMLALACALLGAGIAGPARAEIQINVNRADVQPLPIAVPAFGGGQGPEIAKVIAANLQRSGLFRPLDPASFIEKDMTAAVQPRFGDWKPINAQALVNGQVTVEGGRLRVDFRLWDVFSEQQLLGLQFTSSPENWRRVAHKISDAVYERLTGEKGYFDTRVVYIAGSGPRDRRVKRLAIMDQDGENNRFLTDGGSLALSPRFHPTRDQIAFMSYVNNKPRVYTFDLSNGRQTMLGNFEGITLSPRYSPDGGSIIMAQTRGAGSDIVTIPATGGAPRRLTDSGGSIDVSPCFSPDGQQVVFESDRGGDQQLYVMSASGGGAKRISFGKGRYATPVWSPRGDLIAFTRMTGSTFAIGVMRPDGSGERILSESFYVEGPTFAPNGRVIMFWRETPARDERGNGFSARLVSIDITGFNERAMTTPTDASDPAWSPLPA